MKKKLSLLHIREWSNSDFTTDLPIAVFFDKTCIFFSVFFASHFVFSGSDAVIIYFDCPPTRHRCPTHMILFEYCGQQWETTYVIRQWRSGILPLSDQMKTKIYWFVTHMHSLCVREKLHKRSWRYVNSIKCFVDFVKIFDGREFWPTWSSKR